MGVGGRRERVPEKWEDLLEEVQIFLAPLGTQPRLLALPRLPWARALPSCRWVSYSERQKVGGGAVFWCSIHLCRCLPSLSSCRAQLSVFCSLSSVVGGLSAWWCEKYQSLLFIRLGSCETPTKNTLFLFPSIYWLCLLFKNCFKNFNLRKSVKFTKK